MKQYLIDTIEALWPADSEYPDTRRDGGELLRRAIYNTYPNWRDMPVEVLEEYARLCMRKEWYCQPTGSFEIEQWWEGYLESKAEQPMKEIKSYTSNDGKIFLTEKEALIQDEKHRLKILCEEHFYTDQVDSVLVFLLQNKQTISFLLKRIQELEQPK